MTLRYCTATLLAQVLKFIGGKTKRCSLRSERMHELAVYLFGTYAASAALNELPLCSTK